MTFKSKLVKAPFRIIFHLLSMNIQTSPKYNQTHQDTQLQIQVSNSILQLKFVTCIIGNLSG